MRRSSFSAAAVLLFLFTTGVVGEAVEVGNKLNITPTATVQEMYDSNVFKVKNKNYLKGLFNDDQMDDFISVYVADLNVDYPIENHHIILKGRKEFIRYSHYDKQNYENESLDADAQLRFGSGFHLNPNYSYSSKVISRQNNLNNKQNDFLQEKNLGLGAEYEASAWKIAVAGSLANYNYDIRTNLDREVRNYNTTFTYIFSDTNRWHFKLSRREFRFDNIALTNDNREDDVLLGTSLLFIGNNLLQMEAGQRWKTFSYMPGRNFNGLVGNIRLSHEFSDQSSLSISYERSTETSYFTTTTYYVEDNLNAKFLWQISSKVSSNFSGGYDWINYKGNTVNLNQKMLYRRVGTGINYNPHEDIQLSLSYEFQNRDANLEYRKFDAHQVTASVSISWK